MVNISKTLEDSEWITLSQYASLSQNSKGRAEPEEKDPIRTTYQIDRDRILHSKAFRRLKGKTQVFITPKGDHYRTRLTHTLEVSQIARTIAKALRLNEDLTEAIALGHDLGHAPFGHSGERALNEVCILGFEHPKQSLRVVEVLENNMKGLNLTEETKDGILNHRSSGTPSTLEGKAVQLSDKIAYLHHDVDDAIRAGILTEDDIPAEIKAAAGEDSNQRLKFLVGDIVNHSLGTDEVKMSEKGMEILTAMRNWMFDAVYTNPKAKGEEEKAEGVVRTLYYYFLENPEKLPEEYLNLAKRDDLLERTVCDYVSSMTDSYAADMYSYIFMPTPWTIDLKL